MALSRYDFRMIVSSVDGMIKYTQQLLDDKAGNKKVLLEELEEWIRFRDKMQTMWDKMEERIRDIEHEYPSDYPNT